MSWHVAVVAFVVGGIIGVWGGIFLARSNSSAVKRARELDMELEQTREELVAFKGQVTQHFSKTAELVNALTAGYRSVYTHLAEGARRFSDNDAIKIEGMSATEPLLPSGSQHIDTEATGIYDDTTPEDKEEEGHYEVNLQDTGTEETGRDDRIH